MLLALELHFILSLELQKNFRVRLNIMQNFFKFSVMIVVKYIISNYA